MKIIFIIWKVFEAIFKFCLSNIYCQIKLLILGINEIGAKKDNANSINLF